MSPASRCVFIAVWWVAALAPVGAAVTLMTGRFPEPYDWAAIGFLLSVLLWLVCAPVGVGMGLRARRGGATTAGLAVSLVSTALLLVVIALLFAKGVLGFAAG